MVAGKERGWLHVEKPAARELVQAGDAGEWTNSRSLAWLREASSLSRRIFRAERIEVGQMNAGPAFTPTCACRYGSAAFTPVETLETRFLAKKGQPLEPQEVAAGPRLI
jgi:hypothetical protein